MFIPHLQTYHDIPSTQPPAEIELEVIADAEPENDGWDETLDVANEELDEMHDVVLGSLVP